MYVCTYVYVYATKLSLRRGFNYVAFGNPRFIMYSEEKEVASLF
jgi:hypothetical protein